MKPLIKCRNTTFMVIVIISITTLTFILFEVFSQSNLSNQASKVITSSSKFTQTPQPILSSSDISKSFYDGVELNSAAHIAETRARTSSTKSFITTYSETDDILYCDETTANNLAKPMLNVDDINFCKWAIDPKGGALIIGKSWGKLSKAQQKKHDALNCNLVISSVNSGSDTGEIPVVENPSCDDVWGDGFVHQWRRSINTKAQNLCASPTSSSSVNCIINKNNDRYCSLGNAQIDFSKMHSISNGGNSRLKTRQFDKGFISVQCPSIMLSKSNNKGNKQGKQMNNKDDFSFFPFPEYFSNTHSGSCDIFVNGTTLLFSHDNLKNLGHTIEDYMNVWLALWLDSMNNKHASADKERTTTSARFISSTTLLTIDAMIKVLNMNEELNEFYEHYKRNFKAILTPATLISQSKRSPSSSLQTQSKLTPPRVCFERLLLQPIPPKGFVWTDWEQDQACSFVGPSSLYQRWNIQIRQSYDVFLHDGNNNNNTATSTVSSTTSAIQNSIGSVSHLNSQPKSLSISPPAATPASIIEFTILLIDRKESSNPWGNMRSSRLIKNMPQVEETIQSVFTQVMNSRRDTEIKFQLIKQDMSALTMTQQIQLISRVSFIIGMHGAGLAASNHMSIGINPYSAYASARRLFCCGLIEIMPQGEFAVSRGVGNNARKLGVHFMRLDLPKELSESDGATIPLSSLSTVITQMIDKIINKPSCLLPIVMKDPYLELTTSRSTS